jgi:hypothetical protein
LRKERPHDSKLFSIGKLMEKDWLNLRNSDSSKRVSSLEFNYLFFLNESLILANTKTFLELEAAFSTEVFSDENCTPSPFSFQDYCTFFIIVMPSNQTNNLTNYYSSVKHLRSVEILLKSLMLGL